MKKVLLIGAGKSSGYLIDYLLNFAVAERYELTVADLSEEAALKKTKSLANSKAIALDINNQNERVKHIQEADVVISMLPAFMHFPVAKDCVTLKKHLITASYVSSEIATLHDEALKNDVLLLNEIGLDPGIDHMSAMKVIHEIQQQGGQVTSFKSFCGGLVAPESNNNPWGYKFSWNPRNVIVAGQSTAKFLVDGNYKYLPYQRLFASSEIIEVEGYGKFDAYANRDSLSYRKTYGIENIKTMVRGTLRQHLFCEAWHVFVMLGLTDDSIQIELPKDYTYAQFIASFLPGNGVDLKQQLLNFTGRRSDDPIIDMIVWTGILSNEKIGLDKGSPAAVLQKLLEKKWELTPYDKDMVVMQHLFEFTNKHGVLKKLSSTLVVCGEDSSKTAMAKTVGLPLAMAVRRLIKGEIKLRGVQVPVMPSLYEPILNELTTYGIVFKEKEEVIA
ncbi:MAG TPA: saccharopine dehydrogenase C-terminal domain-containing protein [Bacteroidia bacterium]|nr:saccharopine dehydrogenase C-terminal domain-containing protein [Bacteroidia bacterium]